MGHRQKGKGAKRKRSWHRRGPGPDYAFARAIKKLERAVPNTLEAKEDREDPTV